MPEVIERHVLIRLIPWWTVLHPWPVSSETPVTKGDVLLWNSDWSVGRQRSWLS